MGFAGVGAHEMGKRKKYLPEFQGPSIMKGKQCIVD